MREHRVEFHIGAPRSDVWRLLHPEPPPGAPSPRMITYAHGSIEILEEGDANGQGLVRSCTFRVPRLLLSGGVGRSFEVVIEARRNEYARYVAVGKPLWSRAEGEQHYADAPEGGTRLTFTERYHAFNPVLRALLEGYVHKRISRDNDGQFAAALRRCGEVTLVSSTSRLIR